ncbi:3-dehydroquinate synthase [Nannochloropsis oceanica]
MKTLSTSPLLVLPLLRLLSPLLFVVPCCQTAFLGSELPTLGQGYRRHRHYHPHMTSLELWANCLKRDSKGNHPIPTGATRCFDIKDGLLKASSTPQIRVDEHQGHLYDEQERLIGAAISVKNPEDINNAIKLVGSVDWLVLEFFIDWIQIPCENVIAAAQGSPTRICVKPNKIDDVPGVAFALQTGVDALLLELQDESMWVAAREAQARKDTNRQTAAAGGTAAVAVALGEHHEETAGHISLVPARVINIVSGGLGDRVCLDLVQLLKEGEGCLVGSSAKALALVQAEVLPTGYINPRPFRVNAGPVHSYVLMADGSARYLSEVQAGDQVKVVNWRGQARGVTVGRCKVESRPLVKVAFEWGEEGREGWGEEKKTAQVFLQQAETVRFVGNPGGDGGDGDDEFRLSGTEEEKRQGAGISVTEVIIGKKVLVRAQSKGTHLGRTIEARVEER